jgi:hypothetical protein
MFKTAKKRVSSFSFKNPRWLLFWNFDQLSNATKIAKIHRRVSESIEGRTDRRINQFIYKDKQQHFIDM